MFKSKDEELFDKWLSKCKKEGIIKSYEYEPETFNLFESKNGIQSHVYTPDFKVEWNNEFPYLFRKKWYVHKNNIIWIEVKPSFDRHNMTRLFKINQKWMIDKHGIYVMLLTLKNLKTLSWEKRPNLLMVD